MSKRNKIIYWVATVWLSLGMLTTGIVQLLQLKEEVEMITDLGYPSYFISTLGVWKIVGEIAILVPRYPLVKEWAYGGFFIAMSGAIFSHIAMGSGAAEYFGPTLLIVLTVASWYFRPDDKKLNSVKKISE